MSGLFSGLQNFNANVSSWNTSGVTDMSFTFGGSDTGNGATAFNQPLDFDTSSVTDMSGMFASAVVFNQPLDFDTSSVISMRAMFDGASAFNQPLSVGNVSNASTTRRAILSMGARRRHFATSNVNDVRAMFAGAVAFNQPLRFATPSVTDMSGMLRGALVFKNRLYIKFAYRPVLTATFMASPPAPRPLAAKGTLPSREHMRL